MAEILERCTTCQALLDEEDLFCSNCGTEAPHPDAAEVPSQGAAFVSTHNFQCQNCGASMSYDASAQSLRCPFCGSARLDERHDTRTISPNRVVPFEVPRPNAIATLRGWLKSGFWRPSDLSDAAIVTEMTAVYVPYWVFSARARIFWTADTNRTPPGARGDWFPLAGQHQAQYQGLLVGASGALTPAETAAVCPFELQKAVPPGQVDLENVVYEQFRVQRKYARPLAREGFENLARHDCGKYVPGRCRNLKVNMQLQGLTSEAVLLPVWIMAYQYRKQTFRFLLNGQTGKATGQAPTSWMKVVVAIAVVILLVLLGMVLVAVMQGSSGVGREEPLSPRIMSPVALAKSRTSLDRGPIPPFVSVDGARTWRLLV